MARLLKCPLCGSVLSNAKYNHVMRLDAARAEQLHQAHEKETALQAALLQARRAVKEAKTLAEKKGREFEKKRSERLVQGLEKKLSVANERIQQLQKGSTPQTEGLEFEETLVTRLRREFPDDDIKHEGKGGDVLHTIVANRKPAGLILYECKRYKQIKHDHVRQAARDKRSRQADFAILVTTGTRRGFGGLAREDQVLISAPLAVIPLVHVLRAQILEVARAAVSRAERELLAAAMLDFVVSPQFRGPIEEAVTKTRRAKELLMREVRDHFQVWRDRSDIYQTIDLDLTNITANVGLIRDGSPPKPLVRVKPAPLQLPPIAESKSAAAGSAAA